MGWIGDPSKDGDPVNTKEELLEKLLLKEGFKRTLRGKKTKEIEFNKDDELQKWRIEQHKKLDKLNGK